MARAKGDYLAVMAADLQEPIEVVEQFFALLSADECDVAIGERTGRDDPVTSSFSARAYWWMYRRFVNADFPVGGVDVFGCSRAVATALTQFHERNTSLVGLLFWLGYRRCQVPYVRDARTEGKSGWTSGASCGTCSIASMRSLTCRSSCSKSSEWSDCSHRFIFGTIVVLAYLAGGIDQPGYTPIIITILGSTSAMLIGLGVVGSYVWRAFENGQGRPVTVVARVEEFAGVATDPPVEERQVADG